MASQESLQKRITGVSPKHCSVGDMQKLLRDITNENKWTNTEYYNEFKKLRRVKVEGWLGGWDPNKEDAMLPQYIEEAGDQFVEWITQQSAQSAWYAGDWIQYPELCRWQIYQVVNLLKKARTRAPQGRKEPREEPTTEALRAIPYDPMRDITRGA